jgi:hypothetical protein
MVQPCNENEFSDVIKEMNERTTNNQTGFVTTCCRRHKEGKNRNDETNNFNLRELKVEDLAKTKSMDLHNLSDTNIRCTFDSIDTLSSSNKQDFPKHVSISSIDVTKSFSSCGDKDATGLHIENTLSYSNEHVRTEATEVHSKSPSGFSYTDSDYKHVITEYSTEKLLKIVEDEFEPEELHNLIAVTGVGYQYIQEIYRKYPPNFKECYLEAECSTKTHDSTSSFNYTDKVLDDGQINCLDDVKFVDDAGSGTSGFMSDTCSSNCSFSPRKDNNYSPDRRNSCQIIAEGAFLRNITT